MNLSDVYSLLKLFAFVLANYTIFKEYLIHDLGSVLSTQLEYLQPASWKLLFSLH